jgi:hypothetical protein
MTNANVAQGLRPVGTVGQTGYVGKIERFYSSDATAIGIGDPVTLTGAGGIHTDGKTPICIRGTVGGIHAGVCVGIELIPTDLTMTYKKASQGTFLLVDVDPMTIFEIQEDSAGGSVALADGTKDISIILGTVDTVTGNSKTMIDSSTVAANVALDCLLLRPAPAVDNTAASANSKWLVKLNNHQYGPAIVRLGV